MYPRAYILYTCQPSGLIPILESKDSSPLIWGSLTILPLTLGNAAEELELHGQAEQVVQERHPDVLHALPVLVLKPAMAVDDGLIHHICSKDSSVQGFHALGWSLALKPTPSRPA